MRVRAVDANNDWLYGKSKSDYKTNLLALAQNIKTRLQSHLGDCFFATNEGIDWFNLMGGKNTTKLKLDIAAVLLKTDGVVSIIEVSTTVNSQRLITIQYSVNTIYGTLSNQSFNQGV